MFVIKFAAKGSGKVFMGQKDVYPLAGASMARGHRTFNGTGDKRGSTTIEGSSFALLPLGTTNIDQELVQSVDAYVNGLVTTKMKPDTITIMEITTSDDSSNYKIMSSVEHDNALVGQSGEYFTIQSETATVSTIPEGGEQPTQKTELDFVNLRINGK